MINPALGSLIDKVRGVAVPICIPNAVTPRGLSVEQIKVLAEATDKAGLVKSSLEDGGLVLAGREKNNGNVFIIVNHDTAEGKIYSYTVADKDHNLISVTWLDRLNVIDQYVQILSSFLPPPTRAGGDDEVLV